MVNSTSKSASPPKLTRRSSKPLVLSCVFDGQSASSAFCVKISGWLGLQDLKNSILEQPLPPSFGLVKNAVDLRLWKVCIDSKSSEDEVIRVLDVDKEELKSLETLMDEFTMQPEGGFIRIIIEHARVTTALSDDQIKQDDDAQATTEDPEMSSTVPQVSGTFPQDPAPIDQASPLFREGESQAFNHFDELKRSYQLEKSRMTLRDAEEVIDDLTLQRLNLSSLLLRIAIRPRQVGDREEQILECLHKKEEDTARIVELWRYTRSLADCVGRPSAVYGKTSSSKSIRRLGTRHHGHGRHSSG